MSNCSFGVALAVALLTSVLRADESHDSVQDPSIREWTRQFVDSETGKPLPGIQVDAQIAVPGKDEPQDRLLISDEQGMIKIPLGAGQCTFLNVRGPGWCFARGFPVVGEMPAEWNSTLPKPDPSQTTTTRLYRGTEVRGRLLHPDGTPAAGVTVRAAANCSHEPWINTEFKLNISYSTEHFADWHGRTATAEDGSFSITVPPRGARNWLHLGTTSGDYHAIDTERLEQSNKDHPLVRYAPLEIDIDDENKHAFDESNNTIALGDIYFSRGVVLRGCVIDSTGKPLAAARLLTSSAHGPIAGRKTISRANGTFEFLPMNPGSFRLRVELHESSGQAIRESLDVILRDDEPIQELVVKFGPQYFDAD